MENPVAGTERVVSRYRRLWDDYFPTSQHSSTPVKLTACLTEAAALWGAGGGVILIEVAGTNLLVVAAARGAGLAGDTRVSLPAGSFISESYSRGKMEQVEGLPDGYEILPGVKAGSAVCLPILSGASIKGVLLLWSEEKGHFKEIDFNSLSLFTYYVAILLQVDELGERLGENLVIDPLTGLHNRRQFDRRLRDEVLRASRYSTNLSLVVFDVDDLDGYNSTCGYTLGNLALSDIANIFSKGVREVDAVARIGADEFGVILPETTRIGALRFADRMRSDIAAYPFPVIDEQASASITVCAGISNFPRGASDEASLVANAYEALEVARRQGPDSINLYGETPSTVRVAGEETEQKNRTQA